MTENSPWEWEDESFVPDYAGWRALCIYRKRASEQLVVLRVCGWLKQYRVHRVTRDKGDTHIVPAVWTEYLEDATKLDGFWKLLEPGENLPTTGEIAEQVAYMLMLDQRLLAQRENRQ